MSIETESITSLQNDTERYPQPTNKPTVKPIQPESSTDELRRAYQKQAPNKVPYYIQIKSPRSESETLRRVPEQDLIKLKQTIHGFEIRNAGVNTVSNEELEEYAYARLDLFLLTVSGPIPNIDIQSRIAEIRQMHTLGKGEDEGKKREALNTTKEYLQAMEKAKTECVAIIERLVEHNYDVDPKLLETMVKEFHMLFSLEDSFKGSTLEAIDIYKKRRAEVKKARLDHPNNRQLASLVTGYEFPRLSPIQIEVGPLSIDIITTPKVAKKYWETIGFDLKKFTPGATATSGGRTDSIVQNYTVSASYNDPELTQHHLRHERQHVLNTVHYKAGMGRHIVPEDILNEMLNPTPEIQGDPEKMKSYINKVVYPFFRTHSDNPLDRTRDEILAMKKDGVSAYFGDFWKFDGNVYDHGAGIRTEYQRRFPIYIKQINDVFIDEYARIVKMGVQSFNDLLAVYSRDEVISMLGDVPLRKWPKKVFRLTGKWPNLGEDETEPLDGLRRLANETEF